MAKEKPFRAGMPIPFEPDDASAVDKKKVKPVAPPASAASAPTPKKSSGVFREGMDIPYEPDDASAAPIKKASGGTASARADGIAQRGKTRGTMIMCGGGMARGKK